MKASSAGLSTEDPADDPAEIEAYLQYARENIARSRMLFMKGDLRYAVFSANEGLELCVKAHMPRYTIIDKAIDGRHLPYPAVVKAMMNTTESNMRKSPHIKKQLAHAPEQLRALIAPSKSNCTNLLV